MTRHLLSIADLAQAEFLDLIARSAAIGMVGGEVRPVLQGRVVGMEFRKTSTRTRVSFAAAAARLGATPLTIRSGDLQTNTGETIADTVRVLGGFLAALVVRTAADPQELRAMAAESYLPIINAMTQDEHPTQAISDLAMACRHFGTLDGIEMLYVGEGNNTAAALALAVARIRGMRLVLRMPVGYGLAPEILVRAAALSARYGGSVTERAALPGFEEEQRFDILYATRWQTTGTSKADPDWRERFAPCRVDEAMVERFGRPGAVFMHDLPAVRDEDCEAALLDGPRSIAFAQAEQKMFTAMAVLEWCAGGRLSAE